jgi:membrane-anchored glycerophosphoryl diester phosphodiesterase (GDPDase)
MDIGKAFKDSFNIYIKNFIIILLAGIVSSLLGFLIAPLVGFQMMFVKAKRGGVVAFNDVFAPFSKFTNLALGALWISIVISLCFVPSIVCFYFNWNLVGALLIVAAILLVIYLGVSWMFALLMIYDKGLSIGQGLKASRELVAKNNFWMHLVLVILAGIVGGLGNILWGVGAILTMPLGVGAIAAAYVEETK